MSILTPYNSFSKSFLTTRAIYSLYSWSLCNPSRNPVSSCLNLSIFLRIGLISVIYVFLRSLIYRIIFYLVYLSWASTFLIICFWRMLKSSSNFLRLSEVPFWLYTLRSYYLLSNSLSRLVSSSMHSFLDIVNLPMGRCPSLTCSSCTMELCLLCFCM